MPLSNLPTNLPLKTGLLANRDTYIPTACVYLIVKPAKQYPLSIQCKNPFSTCLKGFLSVLKCRQKQHLMIDFKNNIVFKLRSRIFNGLSQKALITLLNVKKGNMKRE